MKENFAARLAAIPTLPILEVLEATNKFLNGLPDDHYPPSLHFQIKKHVSEMKAQGEKIRK